MVTECQRSVSSRLRASRRSRCASPLRYVRRAESELSELPKESGPGRSLVPHSHPEVTRNDPWWGARPCRAARRARYARRLERFAHRVGGCIRLTDVDHTRNALHPPVTACDDTMSGQRPEPHRTGASAMTSSRIHAYHPNKGQRSCVYVRDNAHRIVYAQGCLIEVTHTVHGPRSVRKDSRGPCRVSGQIQITERINHHLLSGCVRRAMPRPASTSRRRGRRCR